MSRKPMFSSRAWPWIGVVALWSAATMLASAIVEAPVGGRERDSAATRILGRCVNALATAAYDRTDLTFHKGRLAYAEKAFSNDVFQVIRREMAPTGHAHMDGDEIKEIMAWLRIATLLDPNNVTYHLDAAYWLMSRDVSRLDEARQVLLAARSANPETYIVHMALGQFATKIGDRQRARRSFDKSLVLWPGGMLPADDDDNQTKQEKAEQIKIDKKEMLKLRIFLREMNGDTAGAIADLKSILEIFPDSPLVRARIPLVENGQEPPALAEQKWNALRTQEYHHVCEEPAGEHAGHSDEEPKGGRP